MAPEKQRLWKLTILAYKREGISEDEFHEHWTKKHPAVVGEWLKKYGIVKYTQYHTPSWARAMGKEKLELITDESLVDYDGFVELVMPDLQCFAEARKDPYFYKVVQPDEDKFCDMAKSRVTVGWQELYLENGQVVDVTPGKANIISS